MRDLYDVVVVGGGPAGLSCALVLGRARRHTLVCDSGSYRNRASRAMHGYLTREGIPPAAFLEIARGEVAHYPTVELRRAHVTGARRRGAGFEVDVPGAGTVGCRRLVLATGVVDELPDVPGAEELLGSGLYHCPYCDGWELRDQPLVVYGRGEADGAAFALTMTQWSRELVLCTDGPSRCTERALASLARFEIRVVEERVVQFARSGTGVAVHLADGSTLECGAVFFNTTRHQQSDLAARLGCGEAQQEGCDLDSPAGRTSIEGLYVIGDASRDVLQVVVAASEGTRAAMDINRALLREDTILPP